MPMYAKTCDRIPNPYPNATQPIPKPYPMQTQTVPKRKPKRIFFDAAAQICDLSRFDGASIHLPFNPTKCV